jgi:hypothetical protein
MRYAAGAENEPLARSKKGRGALEFLAACLENAETDAERFPWAAALKREIEHARRMPDWYLVHDFNAEFNAPCYFYEFMSRAAEHDLQYVGDTEFSKLVPQELPQRAQELLRRFAGDRLAFEQFMDFLRNRMFRRSVLCRRQHALSRRIEGAAMRGMYFATQLAPEGGQCEPGPEAQVMFKHPNGGGLRSADPLLKTALMQLHAAWPGSIPFQELLARAAAAAPMLVSPEPAETQLARSLLRGVLGDFIECSASPRRFKAAVSANPKASALARAQARTRDEVSSLRHELAALTPPEREALARPEGELGAAPPETLGNLAKKALLIQ